MARRPKLADKAKQLDYALAAANREGMSYGRWRVCHPFALFDKKGNMVWDAKTPMPRDEDGLPDLTENDDKYAAKLCRECGKPMRDGTRKAYCSDECKHKAMQKSCEKQFGRRKCLFCKKDFPVLHNRMVYCSVECREAAYKKGMGDERFCVDCGADITERHGRALYCRECAARREREHKAETMRNARASRPKKPKKPKYCIVCGKDITGKRGGAKYCSISCGNKRRYMDKNAIEGTA